MEIAGSGVTIRPGYIVMATTPLQTINLPPVPSAMVLSDSKGMMTQPWQQWCVNLESKVNVINGIVVELASAGTVTEVFNTISPLTTNGDLLTYNGGNNIRLPIGSNGQILSVVSGLPAWVNASAGSSPLTTKGDIYTYSTTNDRLPVGTDGQVLTADSTSAEGISWQNAGGSSGYVPVALLHFDGTNGSTTFTDEFGSTWVAVSSGSVLDTSQYKFGVSSLHVVNGGITSTGLIINWGNPWKIECFFRRASGAAPGASQLLFGKSTNEGVFIASNTTYGLGYYANGAYRVYTVSYPTGSTWHYIVVEFDGTTVRMAIDGTLIGGTTNNWSSSGQLYIGRDTSGDPYPDWIDEFRVSTITPTFPVPTAPFPPP